MNALTILAAEVRRTRRAVALIEATLLAAGFVGVLAGGALLLARGRWLTLPAPLPFLVWMAGLGAAALVVVRMRPWRAHTAPSRVAATIEDEQGLRRGALGGVIEVAASGGVFARHAAAALGKQLGAVAATPAPRQQQRLRRMAVVALFVMAQVALLSGLSASRATDGWRALLHPVAAWRGALLPPVAIDDVPARVLRGTPLAVGIDARGRRDVRVRWRETGAAWRDSVVPVSATGRANAIIANTDAELRIVVGDGRSWSDTARVVVVDRPFLGEVTLTASFPAYLGRPSERLSADEGVRVPAGTRLTLVARASEPLARASLRTATSALALRVDGRDATLAFVPQESGEWTWEVEGIAQPIEDLPPALRIEVVPDSLPHVEIVAPVGEVFLLPDEQLTVDVVASDDNALRGVWLRRWAERAGGRADVAVDSALAQPTGFAWTGQATFRLDRSLRPGEAMLVELIARDAAPGDRTSRSTPLRVRVPTAEEARAVARSRAESAVDAADAVAQAQADLAARTETEARTRGDRASPSNAAERNPEATGARGDSAAGGSLGYESAERAREIAADQRALEQRVRQLEDAAREMEERLARAGALDPSLAQQLQDAQRLLREAMTPELLAALERLEGATRQLDADRTRQSLAELAAQQERMRAALEKSAELLRRAALEGAMQTLADRAAELASEQRAAADSAARPADASERARRDRDAQSRAQSAAELARNAEALRERLDAAEATTAARGVEAGASESQQAAENLRSAPRDSASERAAAESLDRASESLQRARSQQVAEWRSELTDALDRAVQELLQLARGEDALADQVRGADERTDVRGSQSALQQGTQATQERLTEQARRSALVTPRTQQLVERAQQRVAQATRESMSGAPGRSEQAMREAATALRQAAAQVTRDRERAGAARSASGLPELMEQMQELASQQGALNSELASLIPGAAAGQQQGLDGAGRERARELARTQREVARQLDEVADADPSGRATELAREARALAAALDQGAADPATRARQERLLQRMLDAGRALEQEERDESARRESRAARATATFTPGASPAESARFRTPTWEELRGLSAEDRRLVIEYFRRLNAGGVP